MPAQNADEVLRWKERDGRVALPLPCPRARHGSQQMHGVSGEEDRARLGGSVVSPPHSHRRFHLNRNLFDKNIRPTREMRDGDVA